MKKFVYLFLALLLINTTVQAKDYAKLQIKEMQKVQQYGTTDKYFAENTAIKNTENINIKNPKILTLGGYENIAQDKLKKKQIADEKEYSKILKYLSEKKADNFNRQAYAQDFYSLYRIAEKIIRANNLDYINWRISIENSSEFNATSSDMNCITIYTGLYDTFRDNDDALALIIGHEMSHALLGHSIRKEKHLYRMEKSKRMALASPFAGALAYRINQRRLNSDSKKMEFSSDVEGAKLASKAGYNLDRARETITSMNTMTGTLDRYSTHPAPKYRIQNYDENRKYFMEDEWHNQGIYNLYNSDVLKCKKSSDRHSIIIQRGSGKNSVNYYRPETMAQLYTRYAYGSYVSGEYKNALKYFEKLFELDKSNPSAYLYASYASEALYKQSGHTKYLENARQYANYAQTLDKNNQYIKEQIEAL